MEAGPYRVLTYDSLGSTNDEAMSRLRAGDPGGLFVTASSQTGGRGRQGRVWASPPGNLYASLALRDPAPVALAPQLGFVAGVALAGMLRTRLGGDPRLRLKWPNDVLFAGAKLAGILLESAVFSDGLGCVIGFGINCRSHPDGLAYPATDLRAAGHAVAAPETILADLAVAMAGALGRWRRGEGFRDVRADWIGMAAGLGERVSVTTHQVILHGIFQDLDAAGRLLLETETGPLTIEAGDVFFSSSHGACNIGDGVMRPIVSPGGQHTDG